MVKSVVGQKTFRLVISRVTSQFREMLLEHSAILVVVAISYINAIYSISAMD